MNIRRATPDDIPAVLPLLKSFHEETLAPFGLGFDEASAKETMEIVARDGLALVVETNDPIVVGVIAGMVTPYALNRSVQVFQELVWYVAEDFRRGTVGLRLFDELEKVAAELGVHKIVMANMDNSMRTELAAFFGRKGYFDMETHWIKTVNL